MEDLSVYAKGNKKVYLKSFMLGCDMMSLIPSKHFGCNVDNELEVWQEWMCRDQLRNYYSCPDKR